MKVKLIHPLWTHFPVLLSLAVLIIYIVVSLPLPAKAAVHFGFSGQPNRYSSPWEAIGITLVISVFFLMITVLLDELWARQEEKKTFNWISLIDEIIIGAMTGINIGYISYLNSGAVEFSFPWGWLLLFTGISTALAVVLEEFRPYYPYGGQLPAVENAELRTELQHRIDGNSSFIYWDFQNPLWVTIVTVVIPILLVIGAAFTWGRVPLVPWILIIDAIVLLIPNGGQRTLVTRDSIIVRWGIIGIKVLRLKMSEITQADLHDFAPLKDFGGYGIRFGREMKAIFLRGSRGVRIETVNGKKYLIGSDRPENLLAVVKTILGN